MFGAITDLLKSEKAVAGGVLIIASTVMVILGHMTVEAWTEYTKWIFGIYATGKTVQGGTAIIANALIKSAATPTEVKTAPAPTTTTTT